MTWTFDLNDDAVSTNDARQPFHVVGGKVLDQNEWNAYVYGGDE